MADRTDWKALQQQILDGLDVRAEYERMGVSFTRDVPTEKGWLACHAVGRDDATASAAVFVAGGPARGRYRDMGGDGDSLNLWEFAARHGGHGPDWRGARRHFAEVAGVKLPSGGEPKRPRDQFEVIEAAGSSAGDYALAGWADAKGGFDLAAVRANGGVYARYPKKATAEGSQYVVAFPGHNPPALCDGEPAAWVIANTTGGPLTLFRGPDKKPAESKTLSVGGSVGSLLGTHALGAIAAERDGLPGAPRVGVVWKVEGLSDLLALHHRFDAAGLLGPNFVLSNSQGCLETVKPEWAEVLRGKAVRVVHDCDRPGQVGAANWCAALFGIAAEVRNVVLPFDVTESHGKDLRDYFAAGHTAEDLVALSLRSPAATAASVAESSRDARGNPRVAAGTFDFDGPAAPPDAPPPLTNYHDKKAGLPIRSIADALTGATGGWPKRVGGLLFAATPPGDAAQWLADVNALFAWASAALGGGRGSPVRWGTGESLPTKGEFFAHLTQAAECHDAVESFPHEPPLPRHYYLHPPVRGGDGGALAQLVAAFRPASEIDAMLLRAAFLTPFWGGPGGKRPAFLVTSDEDDGPGKGRGVGKTTLVRVISSLAGGFVSVRPTDGADEIKTRLLSPAATGKRVALIDNIKTHRFSWADLEEMITSDVISGRKLYQGEGRTPNLLTWFFTLNGASLSKDMAQRSVTLALSRPAFSATWEADVAAFVEAYRWEIVGDVLAALRAPAVRPSRPSRWAEWECGVLGRLGDPDAAVAEVARRQSAIDDDRDESEIVRDYLVAELRRRGHDPESDLVSITAAQAHPIVNAATGERMAVNAAGKHLKSLHVPELRKCDRAGGKGWEWRGARARPDARRVPLARSGEEQLRDLYPPADPACGPADGGVPAVTPARREGSYAGPEGPAVGGLPSGGAYYHHGF